MRETSEIEVKLAVPPGYALPELAGEPLEPRTFTSHYHDTADRALARRGVTLRRRVEKRRGLWQLKLPRGGERLELETHGGPARPPEELARLLVGLVRGRPLEPIATLRTRREGLRAHVDGQGVADVTLDTVSVLDGRRVQERFVELEVEALAGGKDVLPRLVRTLRDAGAEPGDGRPKALRAIGFAAEPPRAPKRSAPAPEHVQSAFARLVDALLAHDPGTRLGEDTEELHQLRVAVRRLRALLRAAQPLLEPEETASLRAELSWLGTALGPVRDLDVLLERLRAEAELLEPGERRAARGFLAALDAEREVARAAMLEALSSERYLALLDRLEAAVEKLPLRPSDVALHDLARREFRRLRKSANGLPPYPPDDELHAVRIRGKRARYTAELAARTTGKRARRFVREAKRFQDVVGEHQDAVVAEERIRELAATTRGRHAQLAAGRLIERERARRREARTAFPKAWAALERSGRRAWA